MEVLVDDSSPQIQWYAPVNPWDSNATANPLSNQYLGNTLHFTKDDGASATYEFNGTGISIYGALSGNHGPYEVAIDGEIVSNATGYKPGWHPNTLLYHASDLSSDSEHTVVLTNRRNQNETTAALGAIWLDIDYFIITQSPTANVMTTIYDDLHPAFNYSGADWETFRVNDAGWYANTTHSTKTFQGNVLFTFTGMSVQVFGGANDNHGNYSISLDGGESLEYNGYAPNQRPQAALFTVTGLEDVEHTISITDLGMGDWPALTLDYAVVNSTIVTQDTSTSSSVSKTVTSPSHSNPSIPSGHASTMTVLANDTPSSSSHERLSPAIIAAIVATVILAILAIFLGVFMWRKRKGRGYLGDGTSFGASEQLSPGDRWLRDRG